MPLYTLLGFLIAFGILVSIHEWGHYYAARRLGIHATVFSIGMGPSIWSRVDRHGTRWQICPLLIGGYVKFLGDKDGSSASASPELRKAAMTMTAEERHARFHLRGPAARAAVIAAGPATNIVLGIMLLAGLYMTAGRPSVPPVISQVVSGGPAERAGVLAGDRVFTVNGREADTFTDIQQEISLYPGAMVHLVIDRGPDNARERVALDVKSEVGVVEALGSKQTVGKIGIVSGPSTLERVGPIDAVTTGISDVVRQTRQTFVAISQIVTGARPLADIGGPVKIAETSGHALKAGLAMFVFFVAAFSINLGVMNLLPIPVLDGGALVFCAIEAIVRRPINNRVLGYAHMAGGGALVCLMLLVTYMDVASIVQKLTM